MSRGRPRDKIREYVLRCKAASLSDKDTAARAKCSVRTVSTIVNSPGAKEAIERIRSDALTPEQISAIEYLQGVVNDSTAQHRDRIAAAGQLIRAPIIPDEPEEETERVVGIPIHVHLGDAPPEREKTQQRDATGAAEA